jgi:hypothetical protein
VAGENQAADFVAALLVKIVQRLPVSEKSRINSATRW